MEDAGPTLHKWYINVPCLLNYTILVILQAALSIYTLLYRLRKYHGTVPMDDPISYSQ